MSGWRDAPSGRWLVPAGLAIGVMVILGLAVALDPVRGVTSSGSPFADEAFNAVNARNLVLLGRWSTDSWDLYLVDLPFSVTLAVVFKLFGVGIVQARVVSVVAVGLLVAALAWGLRGPFGRLAAASAALAAGTSGLALFYGRLVYPENVVALLLAAGVVVLASASDRAPLRRGLIAGILFALAIGTKPSAAFAVGGILVAVAIVGRRSASTRSALAVTAAAIAAAGLAWVVAIWLPDPAAVTNVTRIWPPFSWPDSLPSLLRRIADYAVRNDGALTLDLPLVVGGLIGLVLVARRRTTLQGPAAVMSSAAIGWLVGGLGILAVVSYRPNRYVVPLLPAAAILLAAGVCLVGPWISARVPPRPRSAAAGLMCALLAAPGLAAYATWVVGAPSTAPGIQATMAPLVPGGSVVVGVDSALFLMRAPVVTIIPWDGVPGNEGDLYHAAGARWYLTNGDAPPSAVSVPAIAWAARQRVACARWFGTLECLYRVP